MSDHLRELFSPIQIGVMKVKNRLMMSAMSINFGVNQQGQVEERLTRYLVERARGGVGMMLVGGGSVHPGGQELPDLPQFYDDSCLPALKNLVARVKPFDTRFGVQLLHGGRQSYLENKVAPSAIPAPAVVSGRVRALEIAEIKELVACFGDAARRCKTAGFDFIEIHAAHGYLINQFLSPNSNIREDHYGGSFQNRTRFLFEILADIRSKTGPDFPVGVRINGKDYIENGWDLESAVRLAPELEKMGVAYLNVSAGVYGSTELTIPSMYTKQGCFVHLAEKIKNHVDIPVITAGRIKDPRMANQVIKDARADIVALGRSLLADPEYPNKTRAGEFSQIRPCVGCCLGCIHAVLAKEPGSCVVNPDVGREYLLTDKSYTKKPAKVLIVGAGPAGLAAARSFALEGNQVIVCEKESEPGGLLKLASTAPGRSELNDIIVFFRNELRRLDVKILTRTELSLDLIQSENIEMVVLATGSLPEVPIIKGLFSTEMDIVTCVDVFNNPQIAGNKAIVLGGGMTGLITADFLAAESKEVVVLNRKNRFAEEMSSNDRYYLRESLKKHGVQLYKNVTITAIKNDGVDFAVDNKSIELNGVDTLVISEKHTAIREAKNLERQTDIPFHIIGDAKEPRHLMFCISEAEELVKA